MVGAGVSDATGASTGSLGISSWKGVVGGLFGSSSSNEPRVLRGCALKPFLGISKPALVSNPIFSRSRRLKPAAISSRRLSAAVCFSFSFFKFLLEMYAIGKLLLLSLVQTAGQANARVDVLRISDTCTGGKTRALCGITRHTSTQPSFLRIS